MCQVKIITQAGTLLPALLNTERFKTGMIECQTRLNALPQAVSDGFLELVNGFANTLDTTGKQGLRIIQAAIIVIGTYIAGKKVQQELSIKLAQRLVKLSAKILL
jgi:hypothetical protein